ncbi:MAG: M20/M25/M40 family metallo-hydrolase [Gammaproteobacteria bacterium]|nr:M20/M25/M40 family metallo-hydrolase [Gammaproteobacteria bacterium]MDP2141176.1 M20/M25/M40 family metallo-hydrolase [Gammaproteobacteria bacterium]MDP2349150.1 M20/M25/M40 family metallo-hydrolase [Gammaproteobacteria bacterium]
MTVRAMKIRSTSAFSRRVTRSLYTAGAVSHFLITGAALAQTSIGPVVIDSPVVAQFQGVVSAPRVIEALAAIEHNEPETIAEQIRLTEIPAPPFMEEVRAQYYLEQMRGRGLTDAYIDTEGNVIGVRRGTGDGPLLAIAAHLDTVFPIETDVTVEFRDGRYYAPGISDDGRGLTVLLTLIETLDTYAIPTVGDIMFIGNVGEEGLGDLRGIKAIFRDHPEIDGFISIDGSGLSGITTGATGSRRFEFIFTGPGGHSFSAFGLASAIHAMGRAITKIGDLETPLDPKTTFTVGTVRGGTSVNSIAADAVFELDMRSNSADELAKLEQRAKSAALEGVAEENARWNNNGEITVEFRLVGDRPVGSTPVDDPLVQTAALAFAAVDSDLQELRTSSTDSNIPMSMGIPAITITGGGSAGGSHSPEEWFSPENSHFGPQLALLLSLGLAGVEGVSAPLLNRR